MPIPWESKDEYEKRMKWWKEAKFGMFVHWGLYSIPAGVWNETRIPGIGEWIQFNAKISINEYEKLAKQFNPEKFNPDEWVSIAKESGMKYIVITAKHHDGFCLFDSKFTNYTVVKASPFKRDIIGELSKASKKHGIKIGFYYSQTLDWHHKDALGNEWDFNPWEKNFEKYFKDYAIPQVEELIKNYDPDLLWFDIFTPTFEMARELRERIYRLKPQIIINGRINPPIVGRQDWKFICEKIAPKLFGDYISLGDNEIPSQKLPCYWEVPMTLNDTWGFKSYDHNWKSAGKVIQILLTVVSRGGNLLLNVGPTSEGLIPEPAVNVLKEVGNWLNIYGESIYGTIASP
ncbi:MAG: alpha-L-fucosidase, partial [Sulfolobus sp.]|nr:alpha-L-fucosidase [Sulfolobus sp.]